MCDYHYFEIIYMHICTYPINVVDRNISPYQVILARKKFLKFVILFLKYIKYTYFILILLFYLLELLVISIQI